MSINSFIHLLLMSYTKTCARCHQRRRKCVRESPGAPCALCQKDGVPCVERKRAAYGSKKRKRGRPKKKKGRTKKIKKTNTQDTAAAQEKGGESAQENDESAPPDTKGNWFVSEEADKHAFSVFRHLSPSHLGLQVVIRTMFLLTLRKGCWGLCSAVSWLATYTGVPGMDFLSSFFSRSLPERTYQVGDFEHLSPYVMQKHDEMVRPKVAGASVRWSKDNIGGRILFTSYKEHVLGEAIVSSSPRYHQIFVTETNEQIFKNHSSVPFFDSGKYMYDKDDFARCTSAATKIMVEYETFSSGPITKCIPDVTLHQPPNAPIRGCIFITFMLAGTQGLDGVGIHEFVPGAVPAGLDVTLIEKVNEDTGAAKTLIQLLNKK